MKAQHLLAMPCNENCYIVEEVMLCYVRLCYVMLHYAILCCAMLLYVMLYVVVLRKITEKKRKTRFQEGVAETDTPLSNQIATI